MVNAGEVSMMEKELDEFISYLKDVKKTSHNTELSYKRDIAKLEKYLQQMGLDEIKQVSATTLQNYILGMERSGSAAATVSRNIASIKAFF